MNKKRILVVVIAAICTSACATITSLDKPMRTSPKIYSGTLLDLYAIQKHEEGLNRFNVDPPTYPWLDLPGSVLLDTVVLPGTIGLEVLN